MPRHPVAWLIAIVAYPLLIAVVIVGVIALCGGFGEEARTWLTLLMIAASWIISLLGAAGSYPILKWGATLSVIYQLGFIGFGIAALFQGEWGLFWLALAGGIVTPFVGGTLLRIHQAFERSMIERQLNSLSQDDWSSAIDRVRREEGLD